MAIEIKEIHIEGFERVIEAKDSRVGLHTIIAIHNTTLGPAVGGTRIYPYPTIDAALTDVLRLAQGMTDKSALANTKTGGGKSVIIADPKTQKTRELLKSYAEAVNTLKGSYIACEDIGCTDNDMEIVHEYTPYCAGMRTGGMGDPSRFTSRGVYRSIQAVCQKIWSSPSVRGRTIAIQGLGHVGMKLLDSLFWAGAHIIISDINEEFTNYAKQQYGDAITQISPEDIYSVPCDIFAPCAMGGILNETTIDTLQCDAIAGGANNQLATAEIGDLLHKKNILYAPDYLVNSGGLIAAANEYYNEIFNPKAVRDTIETLYNRVLEIFDVAEKENLSPSRAADRLVERALMPQEVHVN